MSPPLPSRLSLRPPSPTPPPSHTGLVPHASGGLAPPAEASGSRANDTHARWRRTPCPPSTWAEPRRTLAPLSRSSSGALHLDKGARLRLPHGQVDGIQDQGHP